MAQRHGAQPGQQLDARAEAGAVGKLLGGNHRQVVRFVEHKQRVAGVNQAAVGLQRRQNQGVICHLQRRRRRLAPRFKKSAVAEKFAFSGIAGVGVGLHLTPVLRIGRLGQGVNVAVPGTGAQFFGAVFKPQLGLVAVAADVALAGPPGVAERFLKLGTEQAVLRLVVERAFEPALADVAPAPFENVITQVGNDLGQARQVFVKQLLLQRDRGRGNDDGFVQHFGRDDGREAIRHRLAGAGARFELG